MVTSETVPPPDSTVNRSITVRDAYEEHAQLIYEILSFFLTETATLESVHYVAQQLLKKLPESGYQKYSKLVCLALVYDYLKSHPIVKVPVQISFDQIFCLFLRDRFQISCSQIAAVVSTSEGSIRTRLEQTRVKMFPLHQAPEEPGFIKSSSHLCIQARQAIEDWDPPHVEEVEVPEPNTAVVQGCPRCEIILRRRIISSSHFLESKGKSIPKSLEKFPALPLLVKEGSRMFFNWTAAPWYIRALFEGLLATTLVLGIVLSVPKIKKLYEFWLERRLDLYTVTELAAGISNTADSAEALKDSRHQDLAPTDSDASVDKKEVEKLAHSDKLFIKPETEFSSRDSDKPSSDKIYRILIKTDAPETLKTSVMKVLKRISYEAASPDGAKGNELPGGIMFDIYVPLKDYKYLMNTLTTQFEARPIITRARDKKDRMPNKAHFKIWLQRI